MYFTAIKLLNLESLVRSISTQFLDAIEIKLYNWKVCDELKEIS